MAVRRKEAAGASIAVLTLASGSMAIPGDGPAAAFTDVTAASGVRFTNHAGSGRLLILDTMGSGLACADFDGDGDDDLYLLTGSQLDARGEGERPPVNRLFRNDGGLRFTDVTDGSGTGIDGWSMGAAAADHDGDGDLDLYVTRYGRNLLLRNEGGLRFADVTEAAGVGDERWGTGAVFFDADRDGDLDLYAVNYVDFAGRLARFGGDLSHEEFAGFNQLPHYFEAQANVLYRNDGDGTFTDVTEASGAADAGGKGLGAVAFDADDDGDLDLYVANDTTPNALLVNRGDGTFDDLAQEAGVALGGSGRPEGSMGIAVGDVDGDRRLDLLVTNFDNEPNSLYLNGGVLAFLEQSRFRRLEQGTRRFVGWGCELEDFDLDGDLDAFFANGHVVTDVPLFLIRHLLPADRLPGVVEPEHFDASYAQRLLLFENDGKGFFADASARAGRFFREEIVARGAIAADLDGDGDLDLAISRSNEPAVVLRNDLAATGSSWIEIGLRDRGMNRFGVGARIEVRAGERRFVRIVSAGDGYLSQRPLARHFGLGAHDGPVDVAIRWPDGGEQLVRGVATRRRIVIEREQGGAGAAAGGAAAGGVK